MDFKKFDPKFSNQLEIEGPEFGDLHSKQLDFLAKNRGKWIPIPTVPLNIRGLTPRRGPVPATRLWWRKTGSFERNGFFNWHTHILNTKMIYTFFIFFLLYGWIETPLHGYYYEKEKDNGDRRNVLYDKLAPRSIPLIKIVSRPS